MIKKLLLLLLLTSPLLAQKGNKEFSIDYIDVRRGLLSNFVTQTISDEDNLKYFATEGGVSRFDGYQFAPYRPSAQYPGLENENIETLFKDRDNNIWIGTKEGGISVLNNRSGQIESFNHLLTTVPQKRLRILTIAQSQNGYIWMGTWGHGIFVIDPVQDRLVTYLPNETPIYKIIRDQKGFMWFISYRKLNRYDEKSKQLVSIPTPYLMHNLIEDTHRNLLWMVGNQGKTVKLISIQPTTRELKEYPTSIEARFVKALAIDPKHRIWFGSWGDGLYISDPNVTKFERINTTPQGGIQENINYSIILDIHFDKNGVAWLGTSHGGVLVLYPNKGFQWVSGNYPPGETIDQNVLSIYQDAAGTLYKGSLTEGLFVRSAKGTFQRIKQVEKSRVNTMYEKQGMLYVGTSLGFYRVPQGDFSRAKRYFPVLKVTSLLLDSKNRLWMGSQESGLKMTTLTSDPNLENWISHAEGEESRELENNRISQIKEDAQGRIWLGTYAGLNLYDEATGKFIPQSALMSKGNLRNPIINDMLIANGRIYCGTPSGLHVYRYQNKKLILEEKFDQSKGLNNDFICGLEMDKQGQIWLSSTTTLSKFNPKTKSFLHYGRENGVMVNSFHNGASFYDTQGRLYFGGSNGVIAFHPEEVATDFRTPDVILTKLTVNNKQLSVGDEVDDRVVLTQSIQKTDRIDLDYAQNHLSLSFAANDFLGTKNVLYEYQLQGHQDTWIQLGEKNEVDFTGLTLGTYTFKVRASRNNQEWSKEKQLVISIASPPWLSWYAFVLYGLLIVGILWLVRYISKREAQLHAELRIVQIEKQKEQELSDAKITFFTNISHEFRTPLTLILSPVLELLESKKVDEGVRTKLNLVQSNAERLLHLINQFLDFKKSEHGLLQLKPTVSDVVRFTHRITQGFDLLANQKQIQLSFVSDIPSQSLTFDADQTEMVLNNLLSNAFKFTPKGGKIQVRVGRCLEGIEIKVADNGIGMTPESMEKIFQRFYQVPQKDALAPIGSGIGLAFSKNIMELHEGSIEVASELQKGTTFRLIFPLPPVNQEEGTVEIPLEDDATISKKPTILVVDDEPDIRQYLRELLSDEFTILEAVDGMEGLALANRENPDLIISDVMMPQMDGISLCKELKGQWSTSHIPVILLTARSSPDFELEGLQTGAEDYITKPFHPGIVKTKVMNLLESRKKLREYFYQKVRLEPNKEDVFESTLDNQFIEKAIQLVRDNLQNEHFGIETMMDQLFMSQSTLFRKIKSLTGMSLTGFIRSIKLQTAAQMILQSDLKLSQVALESGFNDYKYFKKSFEAQYGCLPSEYRAKVLAEKKS